MGVIRVCCVLAMVVAFTGCRREIAVDQPQVEATEAVRSRLEEVAKTGQVGSEVILIEEALKRLQETDAAKAGELLQDLEQLQGTVDPAKAKTLAEAMLGKL